MPYFVENTRRNHNYLTKTRNWIALICDNYHQSSINDIYLQENRACRLVFNIGTTSMLSSHSCQSIQLIWRSGTVHFSTGTRSWNESHWLDQIIGYQHGSPSNVHQATWSSILALYAWPPFIPEDRFKMLLTLVCRHDRVSASYFCCNTPVNCWFGYLILIYCPMEITDISISFTWI